MTQPFVFMTSIQAVQLTGFRAANLAELYEGLRLLDGSSIYHHTYRFLRLLHFLPDTPHSDLAYWIGNNLKEEALAERVESLDLRDFSTIRSLRESILAVVEKANPQPKRWERPVPPGLEFHFCRSTSIVLTTGMEAENVEEFVLGLGKVDIGSLFYHLVEAPLYRDQPAIYPNDFSVWLHEALGLSEEAQTIAQLNPYRWDMETLRGKLIEWLGRGRLRTIVARVLSRHEVSETSAVIRALLQRWRGETKE